MSPQLPSCSGCGSAGGNCASVVVSTGFCADDASSTPLLVRTVVDCEGNLTQTVTLLDGTPYVGPVKQCPPPGASTVAAGVQACYYQPNPLLSTSDIPTEWFSLIPGLPDGSYLIEFTNKYNASNNSTQVLVELLIEGVVVDSYNAGSLGSTDPAIRQPGVLLVCNDLVSTDTISIRVSRPNGSGTASVYSGRIAIWAVA